MALEYKWIISGLDTYPSYEDKKDCVYTVHWRREATDGVNTIDCYGSLNIEYEPDEKWIPFKKLTPADIEDWLNEHFDVVLDPRTPRTLADVDAELASRLAEIAAPTTSSNILPWA